MSSFLNAASCAKVLISLSYYKQPQSWDSVEGGGEAWPEHGCRELLPHAHVCTHAYARIHTSLHHSPGEKLAQELQKAW